MKTDIIKLITGYNIDIEEDIYIDSVGLIDIFIKDRKLGIVLRKSNIHNTYNISKNHNIIMLNNANKLGIRLIFVFDYEWNDSVTREKLIKLFESVLNTNKMRFYARKCKCTILDNGSDIVRRFLNRNHIQGHCTAEFACVISYENKILGMMTFGKPRFNNQFDYELIRLSWEPSVIVVGGANKMLKESMRFANMNNIISYCDISKFEGRVYESLGFREFRTSEPNYKWVNPDNLEYLPRYKTQKAKLIRAGLGTKDDTENSIMMNHGYVKVYDCGNKAYTLTV